MGAAHAFIESRYQAQAFSMPCRCPPTLPVSYASTNNLVGYGVAQRADTFDRAGHHIAMLHVKRRLAGMAYAAWRAGQDHIACLKAHHLAEFMDQFGDIEDHVVGRVRLHRLTIKEG